MMSRICIGMHYLVPFQQLAHLSGASAGTEYEFLKDPGHWLSLETPLLCHFL